MESVTLEDVKDVPSAIVFASLRIAAALNAISSSLDMISWTLREEEEIDRERTVVTQLYRIANSLRDLGNGNAATDMGAIEAFGKVMDDGMGLLASAISEGFDRLKPE